MGTDEKVMWADVVWGNPKGRSPRRHRHYGGPSRRPARHGCSTHREGQLTRQIGVLPCTIPQAVSAT